MSELSCARRLAVEIGRDARERKAFASDLLDTRLGKSGLNAADRAFTRVLVLGVVATVGTLDEVIGRCLDRAGDVGLQLRDALRVSTYEIIFLNKDAYVAVDQGVELAAFVQPRARRLANAVLRRIMAARKSFPFGDPQTDDAALARLYGFPLWMAQMFIAEMGRTSAEHFMAASNEPASVYFGVNALCTSDAAIENAFTREKITLKPVTLPVVSAGESSAQSMPSTHRAPTTQTASSLHGAFATHKEFSGDTESSARTVTISGCFEAPHASTVTSHVARRAFDRGQLLVSDAAAQAVALLALPDVAPTSFLEVGSGRGTKTILLQSNAYRRFGTQMDLTCVDDHEFKMNVASSRAERYGAHISHPLVADGRTLSPAQFNAGFAAALVDAPCSGLGTLRRHPEIRWRLAPRDIAALAELELDLITAAARLVVPSGQLTYATCTVSAAENESVIKRFLASDAGKQWRIVPTPVGGASKLFFKTTLTAGGCDAHFACRLRRIN